MTTCQVLGALTVNGRPLGSIRQRRILAALLVAHGEVVSSDRLIGIAWHGERPPSDKNALQTYVSRLRALVGADSIVVVPPGYRLVPSAVEVDAWRFDRLVADARASPPERALARLDEALALWAGRPYMEFADEDFCRGEVMRLEELHDAARLVRIDVLVRSHRSAEAVAEARCLIEQQPVAEPAWERLMVALAASGRTVEAVRAYHRYRGLLIEEAGLEPSKELAALGRALLQPAAPSPVALEPTEPSPRSVGPPRGLGRVHLTRFVGRHEEKRELAMLVSSARLVTVTGAGGMGKTRLALEAAAATADSFSDGAYLVELGSLARPDALDDFVATSLGLLPAGVSSRQAIIDAVGHRSLLLLLDNAEHVLAPVHSLVMSILDACGSVTIVVTSRQPLAAEGEHVWLVSSLAPDQAAALFADRARLLRPDIDLDSDLVVQLCDRLDGMPLAIELAAARVRSLSVDDILARLSERFTLLSAGRRGAVARHRTMLATIEWSYGLLDEDERTVFCRLGVFAGSFSLAAAIAVARCPSIGPDRVVDLLDSLTAKSMLTSESTGGDSRFRLLETLRYYAVDQLGDSAATVATLHAGYYAQLLARHGGNHYYDDPEGNGPLLLGELDNIRAAVAHAVRTEDVDLAMRLGIRLMNLWYERMLPEPGRWVADVATLASRTDHPRRAIAHGQAALAAAMRSDQDTFERHLEQGAGTWPYYWARVYMGWVPDLELVDTLRHAMELARSDHPLWECGTEGFYIMHAARHGLPFQAEYEHFRAHAPRLMGRTGLAAVAQIEAGLALTRGDRASALAFLDAAVTHSRAADLPVVELAVRVPRLLLAFEKDDRQGLIDAYELLIEMTRRGARRFTLGALSRVAVLLARIGREEAAARLQAFTRTPPGIAIFSDGDPSASIPFTHLSATQLEVARAAGRVLSYEDALALALEELRPYASGCATATAAAARMPPALGADRG